MPPKDNSGETRERKKKLLGVFFYKKPAILLQVRAFFFKQSLLLHERKQQQKRERTEIRNGKSAGERGEESGGFSSFSLFLHLHSTL